MQKMSWPRRRAVSVFLAVIPTLATLVASPLVMASPAVASPQAAVSAGAKVGPAGTKGREAPKPAHMTKINVGRPSSVVHAQLALRPAVVPTPQPEPTAPFTQCPAIGADTSCGVVVQITNSDNNVLDDPTQGPYDGGDDTLVGVLNSSYQPVSSISLSSDTDLFGFDGDGICTYPGGPPCGGTGYEGPNTTFSNINANRSGGTVNFTTPLAPNQTAYFSLEEPLAANAVVAGGPSAQENGAAVNPIVNQTTSSCKQPVNCATGEFWHTFGDFTVPGRGVGLNLNHSYVSAMAAADSPLGFGWTNSYNQFLTTDSAGKVTVHQENASTATFTPNGSGGYSAPPRVLATLTKNADGTLSLSRRSDHVDYVFSSSGQLQREVDLNGYATTLVYNGSQLSTVTDPAGRHLSFSYTGSHISQVADPMGHKVSFSYDTSGNLAKVTDPAGRSWSFTYDPGHLLLTMTDPRGGVTTSTYDSSARVVTQVDPTGAKTTWSYTGNAVSPGGGSTAMTDPNGSVTTTQYTNLEMTSVTKATGTALATTTAFTYDAATLGVTSVTDPLGHVTKSTYDARGNALTVTDPLNRTVTLSYNNLDEVTFATTPLGETTTYRYDAAGNIQTVTDPLGHATTFTYGDTAHGGDVSSSANAAGNITRFSYDTTGDLASVSTSPTTGVTNTSSATYDPDGEPVCEVSPNGIANHLVCPPAGGTRVAGTTTMTYDPDGEMTALIDPLGHTTASSFDANGNQIQTTDPSSHVSKVSYDADNRATSLIRADGTTQHSVFDLNGNQTSQLDASGNATTYRYDGLNRVTGSTDPLGRATSFGYDLAGNRTTLLDPASKTTTNAYDAANQLTGITYSDGKTPKVSYTYDGDGRRSGMTDGTGTSAYTFDQAGHLTSSTNGAGAKVTSGYDAAGRVNVLTYPNAKAVTRTYDGAGRLSTVTDWLGHPTQFTYDADGNPTGQADPNGVQTTSSYDSTDQLNSITDRKGTSTLASFGYTRNNLGDVASSTSTPTPSGKSTYSYSYSPLEQLASQNAQAYSYDKADNLTTSPLGSFTYDKANELTKAMAGSTSTALSFDPNGNRTGATATTTTQNCALCVVSPTATSAVSVTGAAGVNVNGGMAVDSSSPTALAASGAAKINATSITVTGGAAVNPVANVTPVPSTTTAAPGSPFGAVPIPKSTQHHEHPDALDVSGSDIQTADPGVYSTISVSGAGSLTLEPGVYVVTGGVSVTGSGKLTASGVTLYLACGSRKHPCSASKQGAGLTVSGAGQATFNGAASGSPNGLAIVGDPANTSAIHVDGGGKLNITGSVSAPGSSLQLGGGASVTVNGVVAIGAVAASGSAQLKVDGAGAGVSSTTTSTKSYGYDQANRLTAFSTPTVKASYAYNGDGLRTSKTVNGTTTTFAWDQSAGLPLLLDDGSDSYVYGPGGVSIEKITGTTATYLHQDQQGSTRLVTDQSGGVTGSYAYDPYGNVTAHTGASTTLGYDGQYTDSESGLQYLRARYYDPSTAQFINKDPISSVTGEPYEYAAANPLDVTDPSGLNKCEVGWNPTRWGGNAVDCASKVGHAAVTQASSTVVQGVSEIGNGLSDVGVWAGDHASDISAGTGLAALILAPIPGLDVLSIPLGVISAGSGAFATGGDIAKGNFGQAAIDGLGTVFGGAGVVEDLGARTLLSAAQAAWDSGLPVLDLARELESAGATASTLDRIATGLAITGDVTDRMKLFEVGC